MKPSFSLLVISEEPLSKKIKGSLKGLEEPDFLIKTNFSKSGERALSVLEKGDYDLIVASYKTADLSGTGLISKIKEKNRDIPILIIADPADEKNILKDLYEGLEFGVISSVDHERILTQVKKKIQALRDQKNRKEEIEKSMEILREILDSAFNIGIIIIDINNTISFFNRGAEKMLGYSSEEMVGKVTPLVLHADEEIDKRASELSEKKGKKIKGLDLFDEMVKDKGPERSEWTFKKKDGSRIIVDLIVTNIKDASGEKWGAFGIFYDITGRKNLEDEFKSYKIQSSGIIAYIPVPTFAINLEGRVVAWNYAMEEMTGVPADEIFLKGNYEYSIPFYGKRRPMLIDLVTGSEEVMKKWKYEDITKNGDVISADVESVTIKGKKYYIRVSASPIYDAKGNIIGAIESSLDLTHIREVEKALAREKANVEYIIDSLPGMFYMFYMIDKKGKFVRWNRNLETLTGYTAEEISRMKPFEFIEDKYKEQVSESINKAFSEGDSNLEANIVTKDGKKIPFFFSANSENIDGNQYILGMGLDITKAKEREKEIRKLASIVRHSGEMIALANPKGILDFINEAGEQMIGVSENDIAKYNFMDFIPDHQKDKMKSEVIPALNEKRLWEGELRYNNKITGDIIDVHTMMFIIDDPETDEPLYLANVSLNITDQKKAKAALKEVNKKLNLLGSITRHDILNQITIAQGYLEILDMDGLIEKDSKLEEYCVKVTGAIETIKRQILFTKDYKDLGEQSPEWFNVGRIIDSNYKNEGFRSVKLVNETEDLDIFADPLFGKVIYNLFDNAVKHGEKITTIKFYYRKSGEDLNIICEDDGIGIPDEFKEKIFKREHYKNTGLGLFLSREILSITGMSIEENGVSGEGARFVIHIPKGMFRFYG